METTKPTIGSHQRFSMNCSFCCIPFKEKKASKKTLKKFQRNLTKCLGQTKTKYNF